MRVIRTGEAHRRALARETFTGNAFVSSLIEQADAVTVAEVVFTPGARTHWHSHERGQLLIITAGRGLIGTQELPPTPVTTGDLVWTSPGEPHWHGADVDTFMAHTAVSLGATSWTTPVTAQEYALTQREGD